MKEETEMNTRTNGLTLNEMDQVNGGIVITAAGIGIAAVAVGVATAAVKVASVVYDIVKDKD